MVLKMQPLLLLLTTWAQVTTQTVLDPVSSTRILHPTSTVIGLPAVTTTSTSVCNVQASIPEEIQERHSQGVLSEFTPMACLYRCLTTTSCYSWSWNSSAAALNNSNCRMWSADVGEFTPSNTTGVYFSVRDGCIGVVPAYTRNISAPFYGEDGLYINRAVYDCGIEGTATAEYEYYNEYSFNYSSILTCQDECDTEDGCISYSYDYGAKDGNCRMHYQWIAGRIAVGNTGVFFSDGSRKTGYKCFAPKPFGS
ncbi:hypothetical protein N431DRAFT_421305 [Stipitochalara longipes BDJ]|nr:hypothetical protein N431DRAFT_421305 [Stipitochalara longipes BDJ]